MPDHRTLAFRGAPVALPDQGSVSSAYENLVLAYLVSLLYLYPYGISLAASASVRAPDLLGLLCLFFGVTAVATKQRVRADMIFLAVAGPFVLLEIATPIIGAVGYRKPADIVSSMRIAILWLPMILVTMLAKPAALPRFERRVRRILAASLWLNAIYAVVQVAVAFGYAPQWLLFTQLLESWAVEEYFNIVQGLRPAGFFVNTTALAVFGVVCLCFFYAQYAAKRAPADLYYSLAAVFLILLTTSRAAFVAAMLIMMCGWFVLTRGRKFVVLGIFVAAAAAFLMVVDNTIGLDQAFYRFTRLAESGLLADVSFGRRVNETWPAALAVARDYPLGTLISAPRIAVLIDSGYLNYYMQGRWVFIACVVLMLAGQVFIGVRCLRRKAARAAALMIIFVTIYLALGMITTNPARSPLVIAFLVFAFWKLKTDRESRWLSTVPSGTPQS